MKRVRKDRWCRGDSDDDTDAEGGENNNVLQIKNSVYFYGGVDHKSFLSLIKALDDASTDALHRSDWPSEARVYLYIHSNGGDAFVGLSAMDHIRLNRVPIIAIADGYVASAATFMLLGANERKALQNAKILIHQLSTGFWGKYSDLLDEVQNSKELMDNIKSVYEEYTSMSTKEVGRLLNKELHMNAGEALKHGLIDEIW